MRQRRVRPQKAICNHSWREREKERERRRRIKKGRKDDGEVHIEG
jgi:hypothetical protein